MSAGLQLTFPKRPEAWRKLANLRSPSWRVAALNLRDDTPVRICIILRVRAELECEALELTAAGCADSHHSISTNSKRPAALDRV